ncbi:MAG: hypothetical protein ACJ79S_04895 [Gemmatimonadaceae bacterium]
MEHRDRDLDKSVMNPARDDDNVAGNLIGETVGGVSGIAAGMALGSLGGPVGAVIGGLAGALGGWWAGRAVAEAAHNYSEADDAAYRSHYESSPSRLADRSYDEVRPAYQLGHLASRNPDYTGRSFDEVETDLRSGWTSDVSSRYGEWDSVRGYARDAYDRGRVGDTSREAAHDVARGADNVWDRTKAGAERLGDKLADKADDLKDRVDNNPASRPGPDATDRPGR